MGTTQHQNGQFEESYSFDDSHMEPNPGQLGDDWDTMMEEYFDDYEDFRDIDMPSSDDEY
jgi:hypothetical protein